MSRNERRVAGTCEIRTAADGKTTVAGYAAVYDSWSVDLGGFREIIRPGAFARVVSERQDVRALVDHDTSLIIGRTSAGTLRLTDDARGLAFELDPPDTSAGRDVVELIRRGDLTGMSFGFVTRSDRWGHEDGATVRELLDVDVFDVSVVAFPAYPDTDVAMRAMRAWTQTHDGGRENRRRLVEIERAR